MKFTIIFKDGEVYEIEASSLSEALRIARLEQIEKGKTTNIEKIDSESK